MAILQGLLYIVLFIVGLFLLAIAFMVFCAILFCCAIYGAVVGAIRSVISYFAALHEELGGSY